MRNSSETLLDDYLPEFDVRTSYATRIAASPARVYASLWTANFDHWGLTRALYAVRTLPSFPARPIETWRRFRDELFRKRFTLDAMISEASLRLRSGPAKNSCSAQWAAFGVPAENCAQPAQFNSVRPPLREPRRRHGTSKWVYGETAPQNFGPRLEYCARMPQPGDVFARIGC